MIGAVVDLDWDALSLRAFTIIKLKVGQPRNETYRMLDVSIKRLCRMILNHRSIYRIFYYLSCSYFSSLSVLDLMDIHQFEVVLDAKIDYTQLNLTIVDDVLLYLCNLSRINELCRLLLF